VVDSSSWIPLFLLLAKTPSRLFDNRFDESSPLRATPPFYNSFWVQFLAPMAKIKDKNFLRKGYLTGAQIIELSYQKR
jgi:hypothetical protein